MLSAFAVTSDQAKGHVFAVRNPECVVVYSVIR